MTVKIVTDSTADIQEKWLKQFDIRVVPAYIQFGEESYPDDGVALPPPAFYAKLAEAPKPPTSSAPPPGINEQILRDALAEADHVVAITLSKSFSGIHNVMRLSAQNIDTERITVLDSGLLTMGLGWIVIAAAEAAANGASADEVIALVEDLRNRTIVYAGFDTFEYLRRGGRVSSIAASIGTLLQIKPVLEVIDGKVESVARVRTFKKLTPELNRLARQHTPIERLAFVHTNAADKLGPLKEALADITPSEWTVTTEATSAIGAQVGPGALGLAIVKAKQ